MLDDEELGEVEELGDVEELLPGEVDEVPDPIVLELDEGEVVELDELPGLVDELTDAEIDGVH